MTDDLKCAECDCDGNAENCTWIKSGSSGDEAADRIATLEAALADMTQQRDAAMAGAVKVKPLVFSPWRSGGCMGCPQPFQFFITQMQDQNGDFLCHWDSSTYKTLDEAKAHAQACYLPPDPDRLLALTAAAYEDAAAVIEDNMRHAKELGREIWAIPDLRTRTTANALAALSRIEARAEARGMRICADIYYTRCCADDDGDDVYREMTASADATEAAAKGGV